MHVVLFRSRLRTDAGDDYSVAADAMEALARSVPGFVAFRAYEAADGERIAISWWEDEAAIQAFRAHPDHRVAQQNGRANWYAAFDLEVAEILRSQTFPAPDPAEE